MKISKECTEHLLVIQKPLIIRIVMSEIVWWCYWCSQLLQCIHMHITITIRFWARHRHGIALAISSSICTIHFGTVVVLMRRLLLSTNEETTFGLFIRLCLGRTSCRSQLFGYHSHLHLHYWNWRCQTVFSCLCNDMFVVRISCGCCRASTNPLYEPSRASFEQWELLSSRLNSIVKLCWAKRIIRVFGHATNYFYTCANISGIEIYDEKNWKGKRFKRIDTYEQWTKIKRIPPASKIISILLTPATRVLLCIV